MQWCLTSLIICEITNTKAIRAKIRINIHENIKQQLERISPETGDGRLRKRNQLNFLCLLFLVGHNELGASETGATNKTNYGKI